MRSWGVSSVLVKSVLNLASHLVSHTKCYYNPQQDGQMNYEFLSFAEDFRMQIVID